MNPAIHAAIAAHQKRMQQEEEQMSGYNAADLDGWEFKIVRSAIGRFDNPEIIKRLVAEEAQNGWEMLEKFDAYRIRFKRRVEKRALHSGGAIDPYRTSFGVGNAVGPIIGLLVAVIVAGVLLFTRSSGMFAGSPGLWIVLGIIVLLGFGMVFLRRMGRTH